MFKNRIFSFIIFLIFWYILSLVNVQLFPDLGAIYQTFIAEVKNNIYFPLLISSLKHYFPGLIIGTALGIFFGIIINTTNNIGRLIERSFLAFRPIPPLAWIPFLIVGIGINHYSAIILIAIGIFWIGFFQVSVAVKSFDPKLTELGISCGLNQYNLITKIFIPQLLPSIITILRSTSGQAWMFLIASELFGVDGFGLRIWESAGILAMNVVAVYLFSLIILYQFFDSILEILEQKVYKWRRF